MSNDLKIIVVGPTGSGKTELVDILSSASKGFQGNRQPTVGLRILEFPITLEVNNLQTGISVQLWDMSGDERYSSCWPAVAKDADGCMLVYSANDRRQAQDLERYSREFTKNLNASQCLIVAHKMGAIEDKVPKPKLSANIQDAKIVPCNAQDINDSFTQQFSAFLGQVQVAKKKAMEEAEQKMFGEAQNAPKPKKLPKISDTKALLDDQEAPPAQ